MVPKGLRVKLPTSILKSEYGERLKMRSEKRVVKRAISDLFIKIKRLDKRLAEIRLHLRVNPRNTSPSGSLGNETRGLVSETPETEKWGFSSVIWQKF